MSESVQLKQTNLDAVGALMDTLGADTVTATTPSAGCDPRALIFLVGMGRSGTTWLGKIFDSHPETLYLHEAESARRLELPHAPNPEDAAKYRDELLAFVDGLPDIRTSRVSGKLPLFGKRYYRFGQQRLRELWIKASKTLAPIIDRELGIPALVDFRRTPDVRLVWKSVHSLARVGLVADLLPRSRTIVIVRHPCGYASSRLRGEAHGQFLAGNVTDNFAMFHRLLESNHAQQYGLTVEVLRRLDPLERLAWRWLLTHEKALSEARRQANCLVLRYEDLCENPRDVSRRLFEFAGLPWAEQTEAFLEASTSSDEDGYYSVFKDSKKSAYKWREELSRADIDRIMGVVSEGLEISRLYDREA